MQVLTVNRSRPQIVQPETRARLDALTSLRFFAAAEILVFHLAGAFDFLQGGPLEHLALRQGVCLFFVLSGFILTYVHPVLADSKAEGRFFAARFARIWPTYIASLCLFVLIIPSCLNRPDAWSISLACLCMVQTWTLDKPYFTTINTPAWSISTEAFFYLCFPLLLRSFRTHWKQVLILATGLVCLSIWAASTKIASISYEAIPPQIAVNPLCRLFEFVTGMAFGLVYQNYSLRWQSVISSTMATVLELLAVIACAFSTALPQFWQYHYPNNALVEATRVWFLYSGVAPIYGILIFVFACQRGLISKLLTNRPLVILGELSFSIYLFHSPIVAYFGDHLIKHKSGAVLLAIVMSVLTTLLLSRLNLLIMEIPMRQRILELAEKYLFARSAKPQSAETKRLRRHPLPLREITVCLVIFLLLCAFVSLEQQNFRFVSKKQAARYTKLSQPEYQNVVFGDAFALRGLTQQRTQGGIRLELTWQSLKDQTLEFTNAVHAIDDKGNVLAYCDYDQDDEQRHVRKNQFLHDEVFLSDTELHGAGALALTVYGKKPVVHILEPSNCTTDRFHRIVVRLHKLKHQ